MINPESLAYKEPTKKKFRLRKPSKRTSIVLSSILGVALLAGAGWYSYNNLQKQFPAVQGTADSNNPPPPPQEVLGLIESVEGQGASLPDNEIPSVATINDLSKLSDQTFFNGTAVGDKLLLYRSAKRAILFRPSTNKVIKQGRIEVVADHDELDQIADTPESASAEAVLRVQY
jgi:hypothetical protein